MLLFTCKILKNIWLAADTPESNFVSQILEEWHENRKQKWVFCHPTPFCCSSQPWKKWYLLFQATWKLFQPFCVKPSHGNNCGHVQSYKFVKCSWILWWVLKKNTAKPDVLKKTLHNFIQKFLPAKTIKTRPTPQ